MTLFRAGYLATMAPVFIAAIGCSLWSLWLACRGEKPSFVGWPVEASHYYLIQGLFAIPLFVSAFTVLWHVLRACVPLDLKPQMTAKTRQKTARAYGGSILLFFIAVDVTLYQVGGFTLLTQAVRWVMPLLCSGCIVAVTVALRSCGWPLRRAILASIAAVVAQGVWVGLFWR